MLKSVKHIITKKIENFRGNRDNYKNKPKYIPKPSKEDTLNKILRNKIIRFHRDKKQWKYPKMTFKPQDLIEKIGDDPICYLSGRKIDLMDGKSYHLDHIIPKNRGGPNTLDNCNIACREANQAKGNLLYEELIVLCKEILEVHSKKEIS